MSARRTLIVYDRPGPWGVALRREFARAARGPRPSESAAASGPAVDDFDLLEVHTPEDCLARLSAAPQALLAVAICPETCDERLNFLPLVVARFPAVPVVVLADREVAEWQWLARELGAVHFVSSPRALLGVVVIAQRHWNNLPPPDGSAPENIWASLPWA